VLPQLLPVVTVSSGDGSTLEWTSPLWFVSETVRGLARGTPGGLLAAVIGLGAIAVGVGSYWRRARVALGLMTAPMVVTAAVLVGLHHNLWPRFFFFAAATMVLLAIRGGFVIARAVLGALGERVALAGALGVAALSALTVPRAWAPKQQFQRAAQFVEASRKPGDATVAIDAAAAVYAMYPPREGWVLTSSVDSLMRLERDHGRVWAIYTFVPRLRGLHPELARRLESPPYQVQRVFPASVGGGEIHVVLRDAGSDHD
jgi:hypothetical protein